MRLWHRYRLAFLFVAYAALATAVFITYDRSGDTADRITRIERSIVPCRDTGVSRCLVQARRAIRACRTEPRCERLLDGTKPKRKPSRPSSKTPTNPNPGGTSDAPSSQPPPVPAPTGPSGGSGNPGGGNGVGNPGGDNGGGGGPSPGPLPPPPQPPPPPDRPTIGGAGVDVPLVDECKLAPVACK